MAADSYSRLVLFLRIALPLLALGILSTLFLFASKIEPGDVIPFEQAEVEDRVRERRVTRPFYTTQTPDGDNVAYTAEQLITGNSGANEAITLTGLVEFPEGGQVDLAAKSGTFDEQNDLATLTGDVVITTTSGYTLRSQLMTSTLSELNLVSPGRVDGTTPGGTLQAERMEITTQGSSNNMQFLFSGGVKLVYTPKPKE